MIGEYVYETIGDRKSNYYISGNNDAGLLRRHTWVMSKVREKRVSAIIK